MKNTSEEMIGELINRYPSLSSIEESIRQAIFLLRSAYLEDKKLLVCGNGGSAADALHIVGELMKGFLDTRPLNDSLKDKLRLTSAGNCEYLIENLQMPLESIALVSETALLTAYANDVSADLAFAQQVLGYGKEGDVLLAISTSGNSKNVLYAIDVAKAMNMKVIGLVGGKDCNMDELCDVIIKAPETETYKVQELHLPIYHALCATLENEFFG